VAFDAIYGLSFDTPPGESFSLISAQSSMTPTAMLNIGGRGFNPGQGVYDPGNRLIWVNPYSY
jgi:hypothetical protein